MLRLLGTLKVFDRSEGLEEPSGLILNPDTNTFWTVSDDTKRVFTLGLDGAVTRCRTFPVDKKDLEGVTVLPAGGLAAVREKTNEILIIEADDGGVVQTERLSKMDGYAAVRPAFENGPTEKGLEGITVDPATGSLYVIKEARPRLLLEIAPDLSAITAVHRLSRDVGFRAGGVSDKKLDVSGIAYDSHRKRFWIVSDTGRKVFLYDPAARSVVSAPLRVQKKGKLKSLKNAEGVALNADGTILFVITDDKKKSVLAAYEILLPNI
jgi:uncharacterized protein YjiK